MNDMSMPTPEMQVITVSDAAIERVAKLLEDEPEGTMLRVSVEGGGCSGFQYKYELVRETMDGDTVLGTDAVKVLIDDVSKPYLAGSIIDYKVTLMGAAFEIDNPQATASCGCGTSFSL